MQSTPFLSPSTDFTAFLTLYHHLKSEDDFVSAFERKDEVRGLIPVLRDNADEFEHAQAMFSDLYQQHAFYGEPVHESLFLDDHRLAMNRKDDAKRLAPELWEQCFNFPTNYFLKVAMAKAYHRHQDSIFHAHFEENTLNDEQWAYVDEVISMTHYYAPNPLVKLWYTCNNYPILGSLLVAIGILLAVVID
jgi:hypothetical protein